MKTMPAAQSAQKLIAVVKVNLRESMNLLTYLRSWMHLILFDENRVKSGAHPLTNFLRIGNMQLSS